MRPNVIVILADDMGWGDLGCYGATKIPTSHIDRIAAEGVRLTDCHASSAVCSPSRYSLMTGRYAWRSPLKHKVLMGHGPPIIEPSRTTLASLLSGAGYATAAIGKWHLGLGWQWRDGTRRDAFTHGTDIFVDPVTDAGFGVDYTQPFSGGPTTVGFDRFFGISASLDMPPYCFLDQDRVQDVPSQEKSVYITSQRRGLESPGWRDDQVDVTFVRTAQEWLRAEAGKARPVFLYLPLAAPHQPCVPPGFLEGRSAAGSRGDSVCLVDWAVGELDHTLRELGIADDTILIVTSDNGALLDHDDGDVTEHRPNGLWRGQKADIWEAGHRIPFVARWPRRMAPGRVVDDFVCLTDVLPTVAEAACAEAACAAIPMGAAEDGWNILEVLTGVNRPDRRPQPSNPRAIVHHSTEGAFALRRSTWKAIFHSGSGGFSAPKGLPCTAERPEGQLYDLASDPGETCNLWSTEPEIVVGLYRELTGIAGDPSSGVPFDLPLTVTRTPTPSTADPPTNAPILEEPPRLREPTGRNQ